MVHRKLDKNLKDDSSADLLKYLQEKQLRTRRMSRPTPLNKLLSTFIPVTSDGLLSLINLGRSGTARLNLRL
jgi:hypothetical protein